jgi:hypothetical protein
MIGAITFTNLCQAGDLHAIGIAQQGDQQAAHEKRILQIVDFFQEMRRFPDDDRPPRRQCAGRYHTFHSSKESHSFFGDRFWPRTKSQTASVSPIWRSMVRFIATNLRLSFPVSCGVFSK